jgi:hypothetical protein
VDFTSRSATRCRCRLQSRLDPVDGRVGIKAEHPRRVYVRDTRFRPPSFKCLPPGQSADSHVEGDPIDRLATEASDQALARSHLGHGDLPFRCRRKPRSAVRSIGHTQLVDLFLLWYRVMWGSPQAARVKARRVIPHTGGAAHAHGTEPSRSHAGAPLKRASKGQVLSARALQFRGPKRGCLRGGFRTRGRVPACSPGGTSPGWHGMVP